MRAGMRGLVGALVVAATTVAGTPVAVAGTYDVVSCGVPDSGGKNLAWRAEFGGYSDPARGIDIPPDPSSYVIADQCPSQLLIQTASPPANAPFLTSGNWIFDAPAGNRIVRLETWRSGARLRTGANDPEGDTWETFARDEGASVIGGVFGETCTAPPGSIGCSFGSDTGMGAASRAVYDINVSRIAYTISCEYISGCPRYYKDSTSEAAIATIKLFGTRVRISDPTAPSLRIGGPLLAAGWRRPGDPLTYDAADSSGIRAVRLEMAGRTRDEAPQCDFRRPAPCPARRVAAFRVPDGTPDGTHTARIVAEDASGNPQVAQRQISVDGTPPGAFLARARGRSIVIAVSDNASGVASASLEVRRRVSEPFRTANAMLRNGRLRARLPRRNASRMQMRVTVTDNAGNVAQGDPTRLTSMRATFGRRSRRVRNGRVRVAFGRGATLRGRLSRSAGLAVAGQTITAVATVRRRGSRPAAAGSATTDRRGRFALRVPAGPSRNYRLTFGGGAGALGSSRTVSVRVPASSTIRASRRRLPGGGRVRFSGRLRTLGQPVPGRGLLLVLQGHERGRWRTFEDTRADRRGRWRVSYSFSGRPGRYPIRVRIRRQAIFPFDLGYSRALTIRVG